LNSITPQRKIIITNFFIEHILFSLNLTRNEKVAGVSGIKQAYLINAENYFK